MIVSVADLCAHLGISDVVDAERDAYLDGLLRRVEAALLSACGRSDRPFADASASPLVEVLDGTGTGTLFVERPIETVTAITVGDPDVPRDAFSAADLSVSVGGRRVRALQAGRAFGALGEVDAVRVHYSAREESPLEAQLAVLRAAAALYQQRGAEDVSIESEGGVRSELSRAFSDPTWGEAVAQLREPQVG